MKMVLILILALAISGCAIYPYPVYSSLGVIDVSKTGSLLEATFVCPKDPSSFTLVFHDSKGKERSFCAHPDWPIILQFDLIEETGTNSILTKRLTGNQMQFTNWQLPSSSVAFDLPYLKPLLQAEKRYVLKLKVEEGSEGIPQGEIFLFHTVSSKQAQEASNNILYGIGTNAPNCKH